MNAPAAAAQADIRARPPARDGLYEEPATQFERLGRWEFWPWWAVYAPLAPYIAWLGLRHGGLSVCTACNPAIPLGGIVGESKSEILDLLPREWVAPFAVIEPGPPGQRAATLHEFIEEQCGWPLVLKPDRGERGKGVKIVGSANEAAAYLEAQPDRVIAQVHHPGPFEAGVFYVRDPSAAHGFVFSVTDKRFPFVIGDGRATVADLIDAHPRFRRQRAAHMAALGDRAEFVPLRGERITLARLGNHCRGTMFLDGRDLITPQLGAAFEKIMASTRGLNFGRFDVRYSDSEEFAAGSGFSIIEFNGLLSESTNIYDPQFGYWRAQRVLREQWRLAFEVGRGNMAQGSRPATSLEVLAAVRAERRRRNKARPRNL
ncbi:MAG: hypothetical protein KF699_08240 [Phycisphaeraceae bacterium]|nr:hypothetical protein [Phycisphaeraceae bacterium]